MGRKFDRRDYEPEVWETEYREARNAISGSRFVHVNGETFVLSRDGRLKAATRPVRTGDTSEKENAIHDLMNEYESSNE